MKKRRFNLFFILVCLTYIPLCIQAQEVDILDKLNSKDSAESKKAQNVYSKNVVTNEIHNVFFRNIYSSATGNEEQAYNDEVDRLRRFDTKIIDTIILIQKNVFGPNVYDDVNYSTKFENFLSKSFHINTQRRVLANRYLLFKKGDYFSPFRATENMRLIRSSGVIHDMRMTPVLSETDTNHIILYVISQDVFSWGLSDLNYSSGGGMRIGLENVNIAGLAHRFGFTYIFNPKNTIQTNQYNLYYYIPNFFRKQFIDFFVRYQNYDRNDYLESGFVRQFSRPEFEWAGGLVGKYEVSDRVNIAQNYEHGRDYLVDVWISRLFKFRYTKATTNGLILGMRYYKTYFYERPAVSHNLNYSYWNKNLVMMSIGYSRYLYTQDRLVNGFGKTEDLPKGFSTNGVIGIDFSEFGKRYYYGIQFLGQTMNHKKQYTNFSARFGTYSDNSGLSQVTGDAQLLMMSQSYKLGNFRLRNYFKSRATLGFNQDSTDYITLNEYDGIRGIDNFDFKGNSRLTAGFQSTLFLPISVAGFRFATYGLIEIAKIQYGLDKFFKTPFMTGFTAGIAIKNENLIFEVIQLQYGWYPNTSQIYKHGFTFSTILPFRFGSLDISKPNYISYN